MHIKTDKQRFLQLLQPSFFSAVIVFLLAFGLVGVIVGNLSYQGSDIQRDLLYSRNREAAANAQSKTYAIGYNETSSKLEGNHVYQALPGIIFWGFTGLIAYSIVDKLIGVQRAISLAKEELGYVHSDRKMLLHTTYERLGLKLIAIITWFLYSLFFVRLVSPYILALAHVGGSHITSGTGIGYCVLAIILSFVAIHLHIVLARATTLRIRVFGATDPN